MQAIQFGQVTGRYTVSRERARQALTAAAEQVTQKTGVSWNIDLHERGDEIRILGHDYIESQQGTQTVDRSKTFTAEAGTRSRLDEQKAEEMLALLLAGKGFRIDIEG